MIGNREASLLQGVPFRDTVDNQRESQSACRGGMEYIQIFKRQRMCVQAKVHAVAVSCLRPQAEISASIGSLLFSFPNPAPSYHFSIELLQTAIQLPLQLTEVSSCFRMDVHSRWPRESLQSLPTLRSARGMVATS